MARFVPMRSEYSKKGYLFPTVLRDAVGSRDKRYVADSKRLPFGQNHGTEGTKRTGRFQFSPFLFWHYFQPFHVLHFIFPRQQRLTMVVIKGKRERA